jgi:hypothetical protein
MTQLARKSPEVHALLQATLNKKNNAINNIPGIQNMIISARPSIGPPGNFVSVILRNGLGNRIIQLLAAMGYAERYKKICVISRALVSDGIKPHEKGLEDMLIKIFPNLPVINSIQHYTILTEKKEMNYSELPRYETNVVLQGYFQDEKYFPSKPYIPVIRKAYYENTFFIHIRAGDYLVPGSFGLNLVEYHKRCIANIGSDLGEAAKYIVFSNDNVYADNYMKQFGIKYTISNKINPLESLIEMANCAGGICANSTFSWLGAFFQREPRGKIFMPSVWLKGRDCRGIYPTWATVIDIDSNTLSDPLPALSQFQLPLVPSPLSRHIHLAEQIKLAQQMKIAQQNNLALAPTQAQAPTHQLSLSPRQQANDVSNQMGIVSVNLGNCGLGNKIFKILAGLAYAEKYNKEFVISRSITDYIGPQKHTQNLEQCIRKLFHNICWINSMPPHTVIKESTNLNNYSGNVVLDGYFQNEKYFPSSLIIPDIRTSYYPNTYFVHIRAGDYLQDPARLGYDKTAYYKNCFTLLGNQVKYIVFSNDNQYADTYMKQFNLQYTISDKVEPLETLIEMANCAGGICANSSFSWLGGFFQRDTRGKVYMPSVWIKNMPNITGFYPSWATVVDVKLNLEKPIISEPIIITWITLINYGYIEFTKNFIESMRRNNCIFSLIVYCTDMESYNIMNNYKDITCIYAQPFLKFKMSNELNSWGEINYKHLVFAKLDAIQYSLLKYTNTYIGYIDMDIIVLKNPTNTIIESFRSNPDAIFVSQCDEPNSKCSNVNKCQHLCSGVIVFKNTDITSKLLEYTDNDITNFSSDQAFILDIANKYNIPHITIEKNIFLNGAYPGVNNDTQLIIPNTAEIIHYNWLTGKNKIKYMKKNNMWYMEKKDIVLIKGHNAGLGSLFNSMIVGIDMIKKKYSNAFPVVIWDNTCYGKENIFNKYFTINGGVYSSEYLNYYEYNILDTLSCLSFQNDVHNYRSILHNIYKNNIQVNPIITHKVNIIFMNIKYDYLIGVHFRNTDRCIEPQYASPGSDKVSKRVLDVLNTNRGKKIGIYIASDNKPDVNFFKNYIEKNYNDFISIEFIEDPDAIRSDNEISIHGTHDRGNDTFTPEQKILSILVDIYSLARCDIMVRTCSNVTCSAGIINKNSRIIDVSLEYGKFTEKWLSE